MAYKTGTNLFSTPSTYNRYYRDFRGVDFSSDHTEVNLNRFAYLVNMYKDYRNGQGVGIETIPGYHKVPIRIGSASGAEVKDLIDLKYFRLTNVYKTFDYAAILYRASVSEYRIAIVKITGNENAKTYISQINISNAGEFMTCFEFRGKFYIISGGKFFFISSSDNVGTPVGYRLYDDAYSDPNPYGHIPTTYIGIQPGEDGNVKNPGVEYEQKNLIHGMFNNTFVADGFSKEFSLSERIVPVDNRDGVYYLDAYGINFINAGNVGISEFTASISNATAAANAQGKNAFVSATVDATNGTIQVGAAMPAPFSDYGYTASSSAPQIGTYYVVVHTYVEHTEEGEDIQRCDVIPQYYKKSAVYNNVVTTFAPIPAPQTAGYAEGYAGVKVSANGSVYTFDGIGGTISGKEAIFGCRLATVFDNRVFLTGNPKLPNHIFWCGIPAEADGVPDPTYFGALNFEQDGIGQTPNMGMFPVADTLCVIKNDTVTDGVVYYHTPVVQGNDIVPKIYPSSRGISGQGCISLGGAINFRDDPVFITHEGIDAIGQLSARYERATEHRSSLVDVKLRSYDLTKAKLEVYDGYLLVLTDDGHVFMADSRQMYTDKTGVGQYEWFMLEGIGSWDNQYDAYRYGKYFPTPTFADDVKSIVGGVTLEIASEVYDYNVGIKRDLRGLIANPSNATEGGSINSYTYTVNYTDYDDEGNEIESSVDFKFGVRAVQDENGETHYYYLEHALRSEGQFSNPPVANYEQTGGDFHSAKFIKTVGEDLFIGTVDGLYKFNFNVRNADGTLPMSKGDIDVYSRDGRCYESGCATLMDNCGIPHLEKKTVTKTLVIKTKSEKESVAKLRVRTNRKSYEQIARLGDGNLDFQRLDFSETAFTATPNSLFAIKEKERHWVEKQYYLYNDEFNKSFCLYYIAYQYQVQGKYKNK